MRAIISKKQNTEMPSKAGNYTIVAIASSTGGPRALQSILPNIPKDFDAPILVVQHMPDGFTKTLAERLDCLSQIKVCEAENGMTIEKGCAYIAKAGLHMQVAKKNHKMVLKLTDEPPREGVKPCADYMYESLADSLYDKVISVVLTGMGSDGTVGIQTLSKAKETCVIAQDEKSCVVYGMPGSIVKNNIECKCVPLKNIVKEIIKETGVNNNGC